MNKILHSIILILFGGACWFLSMVLLKLPLMVQAMTARLPSASPGLPALPAFTRFCMVAGPCLLAVFAFLALGYCVYVWVQKTERPAPWTGFLATTMTGLVLVLLPAGVALYLPLVDFLNRSTVLPPK